MAVASHLGQYREAPAQLLGLATIPAGTGLAVALIPEKFNYAGSLFVSALLMSAGILAPVVLAAVRRPYNLVRCENLILVGLVYWILLDLLQNQNEPHGVTLDAVQFAFLSIGLFGSAVCLGTMVFSWTLPRRVLVAAQVEVAPNILFGSMVACFLLGMTHYLVSCEFDIELLFRSLGKPRFSAPWSSARAGRFGGWSAFREHLVYFGYLVPTLTVLVAKFYGWQSVQSIVAIACSVIVLLFASQSGTRSEIGVIVGAGVLCWFLSQRMLTVGLAMKLGFVVVLLLIWMQFVLAVRNAGLWRFLSSDTEVESKISVDDNFSRICQVMDLIPNRVDHTYGGQLYYVAVRPIPRAIWQGKPTDAGFSFEQHVGTDEVTTLSVTMIAELYYDFGFPFIFIGGVLYGGLARMWNALLEVRRGVVWPMLYGLGAMALFVGIRSEQAFVVRTYPIIFWLALSAILNFKSLPVPPRRVIVTSNRNEGPADKRMVA